MNDPTQNSPEFTGMVREFLRDHPEHIAGTANDPAPEQGKTGLCLDKRAALALMEWSLKHGAYTDRAKLEANIAKFREELDGKKGNQP